LNDVRFFVIVTGLALVTLVLTFVLFRFFAIAGGGTGEAPRRNDQVRRIARGIPTGLQYSSSAHFPDCGLIPA
jgi:hypothetical protein